MPENVIAKLTSRKWLREAISGRARNFANSFTFTSTIIEREVAGEKHAFFIGNVTGKSWYGSKTDASYEMRFVKDNLIKRGAIVFECGAHHGAQTILLSRWVGGSGKVIAIEPIPENVAILKRNIDLNRLTNVLVVDRAVGSQCGHQSMTRKSNGAISVTPRKGIQVVSITLDRLAEELGLNPTFIKIDVEGYEYQVLEGCKLVLSTTPALFVEVHTLTLPRYGNRFEDLWKSVDHKLYDIFVQAEDFEEPVPYSPNVVPEQSRVHFFFKPKL
jgi:FkbM family methyltransferase